MTPSLSVTEGYVDFNVPSVPKPCRTYYKIIGTLNPSIPPLIAIHGGPSISSEYLEILSSVTEGQPNSLILYDQLGSARSTHVPERLGDTDFWTVQLFVDELKNLLRELEITEYDLLGHSWGGTLALSFAVQSPPGLRRLIIFSSQPSTKLLVEGHNELKLSMPSEIREAFDKYERDGQITPEYRKARGYYDAHYTCKIIPMPEPIVKAFAWGAKDPTVQLTMFGRGTFEITGPMKDWTVIDQLANIQAPTLVINGLDDSSRDTAIAPFMEKIPDVRWVKFMDSSHMAHFEEREKFTGTIRAFLYRD